MYLKNFFDEDIDVTSLDNAKQEISRKYGLPEEYQKLFLHGDEAFFSVDEKSNKKITKKNFDKKKDDLICNTNILNELNDDETKAKEYILQLGASEDDFYYFYNQLKDIELVKQSLFPYCFQSKAQKNAVFDSTLDVTDIDNFVGSLGESQKNYILNNLDSYIDYYLN